MSVSPRWLLLAVLAIARSAHGQFLPTGAGPLIYNDPANWTDGNINGNFSQTLTANQTVLVPSDLFAAVSIYFRGSYDLTLRGNQPSVSSLHLTNDLLFDSVDGRRTVFIGSPTAQNQVEVKLASVGGFNVAATDTLVLWNRVSGTGLGKVGDGTMILRGANTYIGGTGINGGVVEVSADNNLGAVSGVPTNNLFFGGNPFTPGVLRLTASFDIHPNRLIKLDFGTGGAIDTNGFNTTYAGSIIGDATNSYFHKRGTGELRLKGANTYGGATFVSSGTLVWDYTANNGSKQVAGDIRLAGRSTLALIGSDSAATVQGITNLIVGGNSAIRLTSGAGQSVTFNAGTLQRSTGTLDLTLPLSGGIHVNTPAITGVLGYATVDATDWAFRNAGGFLVRLPAYDLDALSAGANADLTTSQTVASSTAIGSLRFHTPSAVNVTLDPAVRLTVGAAGRTGGILVTGNVGSNAVTISGGQLTANTGDLTIIQNNPAQPMTISSSIVNGAAAIRLTKSGPGTLILTEANTYTGGTDIVNGTVRLSGAGRLPASQPVSLGESATLDLNGISHTIGNLLGNAGSVIALGGATLTLAITASNGFDGVITGAGGLIKLGNTTQFLRGANTYTGPTVIEAGILILAGNGSLPATTSLILNGTTGQTGLDLGGQIQSVVNLNSTFAGARIFGPGTLTIGSGNGVYAGDFFSSALVKDGAGSTTVLGGAAAPIHTTLRAGTVAITHHTAVGALTFDGGMLQFRADFSGLPVGGTILLKHVDSVVDTNGFGGSLTAGISGPGRLTKIGAGTLTLGSEFAPANPFAGGLTVNGGTVIAATDGALGAAGTDVRLNNGALSATGTIPRNVILGVDGGALGSGTAATYSGVVSGLGALSVNTPGAVTLTAQNTYAGGTTVGPAGALLATSGNRSLGSGPVTVLSGGLLGLSTAANLAPGLLVALRPGAALAVLNTTIDPAAVIDPDPAKTTGGILALGAPIYDRPLDMATIGNGRLFLSAFGSTAYTPSNLGANNDGVYRLGAGAAVGANTLTISGTDNLLTGARRVIIGSAEATGNATVALLNANDYSGGTTLAGGTLAVGNSGSLGAGPIAIHGGVIKAQAALTLSNPIMVGGDFRVEADSLAINLNGAVDLGGGTRKITFGTANFVSPVLQINGPISNGALSILGGSLILTNANDYAGGTTILVGPLRSTAQGALGTGPITLGGSLAISGTPQVLANSIVANGGSITFDVATNLTGPISSTAPLATFLTLGGSAANVVIGGSISDGPNPLGVVKSGSGVIALTGINSYRGGTSFSAGTIAATTDANLGAALSTAGNLIFRGGTLRYDAAFALNPIRSFGIQSNSSTAPTIDTNGFDVTIGNAITGNASTGSVGRLIKGGAGKLTLTGSNTFLNTTLNAGTLQYNSIAAMGGGSTTMAPGTIVAAGFAMNQTFLNKLTKSSNAIVALGANTSQPLDFSGSNWRLGAIGNFTLSSTLTTNAAAYRLGGGGGTLTLSFSNALTGAPGLDIDGGGTVVIANTNAYTGPTTIHSGTLKLSASGTFPGTLPGTSSIALANNATLDASAIATGFALGSTKRLTGNGRVIGKITGAIGSIVAPGSTAAPFGELTLGDTALRGRYLADIDALGQHDLLTIDGNLDLTSLSDGLTVTALDSPLGEYVLATYSGTLTGVFDSLTLPPGSGLDYGTGSNSQIRLVPEPGTGMLAVVGGLGLANRRRRAAR